MSSAASSEDASSLDWEEVFEEEFEHETNDSGCQVCRDLWLPMQDIETTYAELQRTAADGCDLCDLFRQACETVSQSEGRSARKSYKVRLNSSQQNGMEIGVQWFSKEPCKPVDFGMSRAGYSSKRISSCVLTVQSSH